MVNNRKGSKAPQPNLAKQQNAAKQPAAKRSKVGGGDAKSRSEPLTMEIDGVTHYRIPLMRKVPAVPKPYFAEGVMKDNFRPNATTFRPVLKVKQLSSQAKLVRLDATLEIEGFDSKHVELKPNWTIDRLARFSPEGWFINEPETQEKLGTSKITLKSQLNRFPRDARSASLDFGVILADHFCTTEDMLWGGRYIINAVFALPVIEQNEARFLANKTFDVEASWEPTAGAFLADGLVPVLPSMPSTAPMFDLHRSPMIRVTSLADVGSGQQSVSEILDALRSRDDNSAEDMATWINSVLMTSTKQKDRNAKVTADLLREKDT